MTNFKVLKEKISNKILNIRIFQGGTENKKGINKEKSSPFDMNFYIDKISVSPKNEQNHLDYSLAAFNEGLYYLAYSELKTAEFLGINDAVISELKERFLKKIEDPLDMDHNQYYRYITLKNELISRAGSEEFSVLDVGGGFGQLASFIPRSKYCLVEPSVNGLSGLELPFAENTFDYVVSCHVLEHIPESDRSVFLDQLLSKAKRGVILLNPFHLDNTSEDDRLKLFVEITNADWAIEHLECGLPKIEEIEDYARKKGIGVTIKENGTMTTTMAMVFVSYFSTRLGETESLKKINRMYNQNFLDMLASEKTPTAYLIYFDVSQ
jgi:SAM-dependent methyltransferase